MDFPVSFWAGFTSGTQLRIKSTRKELMLIHTLLSVYFLTHATIGSKKSLVILTTWVRKCLAKSKETSDTKARSVLTTMALQVRKHLQLRGDTKQRMAHPMKWSDSIYQHKQNDILKRDSLLGLHNRKYSYYFDKWATHRSLKLPTKNAN